MTVATWQEALLRGQVTVRPHVAVTSGSMSRDRVLSTPRSTWAVSSGLGTEQESWAGTSSQHPASTELALWGEGVHTWSWPFPSSSSTVSTGDVLDAQLPTDRWMDALIAALQSGHSPKLQGHKATTTAVWSPQQPYCDGWVRDTKGLQGGDGSETAKTRQWVITRARTHTRAHTYIHTHTHTHSL